MSAVFALTYDDDYPRLNGMTLAHGFFHLGKKKCSEQTYRVTVDSQWLDSVGACSYPFILIHFLSEAGGLKNEM